MNDARATRASPESRSASQTHRTNRRITASSPRSTGTGSPRLFHILAAIAVAPIPIAVIRNGLMKWYPTRDAALTGVWVRDVFSSHPPLYGLAASQSWSSDVPFHYLGALHFYLLALPMKLFGVSWGLLTAAGALNVLWCLIALWSIRRRVGYRAGLIGCVWVASLIWALGSQLLIDPTPVHASPLLFLAFCTLAWSVSAGDTKTIVPFIVTANYLFLLHPKVVLVVPAITVFAFASLGRRVSRLRRDDNEDWLRTRKRLIRALVWSLVVSAFAWLPAVIEQFIEPGGNLRAWGTMMLQKSAGAPHHLSDVVGLASSTATTWPLWFRDSLGNPNFTRTGPSVPFVVGAIGIGLMTAVAGFATTAARRRRDDTILSGLAIAGLAWAGWVVSFWRLPSRTFNYHYLVDLWPTAAFIWLILVFACLRTGWAQVLVQPARREKGATVATFAFTILLSVMAVPITSYLTSDPGTSIPLTNQLRRDLATLSPSDGPIVVSSEAYPARSLLSTTLLMLEEQHIEARVTGWWNSIVYPTSAVHDPARTPVRHELSIVNRPVGVPSEARLVFAGGPALREPSTTYIERYQILVDWARTAGPLLEIDEDAQLSDEGRTFIQATIDAVEADAQKQRVTILETPKGAQALWAATTRPQYIRIAPLPSEITMAEFQMWIEDHRAVMVGRRSTFAFLVPVP